MLILCFCRLVLRLIFYWFFVCACLCWAHCPVEHHWIFWRFSEWIQVRPQSKAKAFVDCMAVSCSHSAFTNYLTMSGFVSLVEQDFESFEAVQEYNLGEQRVLLHLTWLRLKGIKSAKKLKMKYSTNSSLNMKMWVLKFESIWLC